MYTNKHRQVGLDSVPSLLLFGFDISILFEAEGQLESLPHSRLLIQSALLECAQSLLQGSDLVASARTLRSIRAPWTMETVGSFIT